MDNSSKISILTPGLLREFLFGEKPHSPDSSEIEKRKNHGTDKEGDKDSGMEHMQDIPIRPACENGEKNRGE